MIRKNKTNLFLAFLITCSFMSMQKSEASANCVPNTTVSFVDTGYGINTIGNPDGAINVRPSYAGTVAAFTRYQGVNFRVNDSGAGCNKKRHVTVRWNQQITIFMPPVHKVGQCMYNNILTHELEHVKIFREVPKSFENEIIKIASKSSNPQSDLNKLQRSITQEARRRNNEFHNFERSVSYQGCGMNTQSKSEYTWSSLLGYR